MKFQTQNIHHCFQPPQKAMFISHQNTRIKKQFWKYSILSKKKTILICIFKMFQEIKCLKLSQLIKKTPEFKTCQLHYTQDKMSSPAGFSKSWSIHFFISFSIFSFCWIFFLNQEFWRRHFQVEIEYEQLLKIKGNYIKSIQKYKGKCIYIYIY